MCGIFALSRAPKTSIPNGMRFAFAGALAIEKRGRHATGFAWADDEGWPWYWKEKGPASRVVYRAPLPKSGLRTVVGHTRYATTGDPKVYENNHPVVAPGLTLVHNGRVNNADELIALTGAEPVGEVDSESLAWLLHHAAELGAEHPTDVLELVDGVAAIAWIDGYEPDVLHLARLSTRPMTIGWTRRGDLVMSSTPQTMAETARLSGVNIGKVRQLPEGTYLRVERGRITEEVRFDVQDSEGIVVEDVAVPQQPQLTGSTDIDWSNLVPRRGWK